MLSVIFLFLIGNINSTPISNDGECLVEDKLFPDNVVYGEYSLRGAVTNKQSLWPDGVIPYIIDSSLDFLQDRIEAVMRIYESITCIRFKRLKNETVDNYVNIYLGNGCHSLVGRFPLAFQFLSLGLGCHSIGTITHELGHTIGLHHEHNRSDRDDYLEIIWDNVKAGRQSQFQKLLPQQNLLLNEFDYHSIMLYGDTTFSKDGYSKTMIAKKSGFGRLRKVAEKDGLSTSDIQRINLLYNCKK